MRLNWVYILIFCAQAAVCQTPAIDSLEGKLGQSHGKQKVDLLNQLIFELINRDKEKATEYFNQSLALAKKTEYIQGMARAYTYIGVDDYLSGEFTSGRKNLRIGVAFSIAARDKENLGYALMQMGNSFLNQTNLDSGIYFYNKSYEILKDSANPLNLSKLYRSLVTVYELRSQIDLEKKYLQRCLRIRELLNNKRFIADALILNAAVNIEEHDYSSAQVHLDKARTLLNSKKLEGAETIADCQYRQGVVYFRTAKFEKALALFDSSLNYYVKNGILIKYVRLQTDLGRIFNGRAEYESALKYLSDALKVARSKQFAVELSDIYSEIGWANFNLGDIKQSLAYADTAIKWVHDKNIPSREAEALLLKGISLSYLKDFKNAELSISKALSIREKLGDPQKIAVVYYNFGYMELAKPDFAKALANFKKSLEVLNKYNNDSDKLWCEVGLARTYIGLGKYDLAEQHLSQSQLKTIQFGDKELLLMIYNAFQRLYEVQGKFKESLGYSKLAYSLQDSLHRSDVGKRFAILQHSDQIRMRDLSIKSLTQEKELAKERIIFQRRLILFSAALILALGFAVTIYARFYIRVKRLHKAVNIQKEELERQANYIHELNRNLEGKVTEKTLDLQQTNQELIKQNNDLLQFSYTVSHNLRGPVARLLGLTNIFQYSKTLNDQNEMINFIRQSTKDLDNTLSDLSKIIDIKNDLHRNNELVFLNDEWERSCALLKDVIHEEFQICCNFENTKTLFTIKAFIQSLFYNLISNSIKYRSESRVLQVSATGRFENGDAVIEFKDNGLGMDIDKHRNSLFKLFKRFHTHVEGRGLGLYLIKSQVEALNGTIEIHSSIDGGTQFKVTLPRAKPGHLSSDLGEKLSGVNDNLEVTSK